MPQLLLILGAILALVGLGSIAAGAPDWLLGLSLGATLIQSGTIAFVGGLILVGLGLVLYVLQDLLRRLDAVSQGVAPARPAMLPPGEQAAPSAARQAAAAGARQQAQPDGQPRMREREPAPVAAEAPAAREGAGGETPRRRERREPAPEFAGDDRFAERAPGMEPQRPHRERPRDADETPRPREARNEEVAQPRRPAPPLADDDETPPMRRAAAAVYGEEDGARSRQRPRGETAQDEIPRFRPERPREQGEDAQQRAPRRDFAPIPSIPQPFGGEGRRAPEPGRDAEPSAPKFRPAEAAPQRPGGDTVVRSGVIGGMAYTLYVDGSIEAELPIGTVRFNSIAELQDHVLRTGAEADGDFDDQQR